MSGRWPSWPKVIAIGIRHGSSPWSDLILPGTSYLERDGAYVNLEGRLPADPPRGDPTGARQSLFSLRAPR